MSNATEDRITHTCGHEVLHRFSGSAAQWAERRRWLAGKPCQTCWQVEQRTATADESADRGLPELQGAADDIAWAEVIRAKAVTHNATFHGQIARASTEGEGDPTRDAVGLAADRAMSELNEQVDAAWWIEHRFAALSYVRQATIDAVTALNDGTDGGEA